MVNNISVCISAAIGVSTKVPVVSNMHSYANQCGTIKLYRQSGLVNKVDMCQALILQKGGSWQCDFEQTPGRTERYQNGNMAMNFARLVVRR